MIKTLKAQVSNSLFSFLRTVFGSNSWLNPLFLWVCSKPIRSEPLYSTFYPCRRVKAVPVIRHLRAFSFCPSLVVLGGTSYLLGQWRIALGYNNPYKYHVETKDTPDIVLTVSIPSYLKALCHRLYLYS